jgi:hypothetical protein
MRRRTLLVVLAGLAVVLASGAVVLLHAEPRHDFTRQDFKRLRLGVTRAEAEAVLGCPADDYRSLETKYDDDDDVHEFIGDIFNDDGLLIYWESDSGSIGVKLIGQGPSRSVRATTTGCPQSARKPPLAGQAPVAPLVPVIGDSMRRRKLLVALAGLAVVVAAGVVVLWPREDRVTRANYDRVLIGMKRADVEAILGPPGDYRTGLGETGNEAVYGMYWDYDLDLDVTLPNWSRFPGQSPEDLSLLASWMSDSFLIGITIDESGQVVDKLGLPRRKTYGQLDNLLWRAKRQWHRWFP